MPFELKITETLNATLKKVSAINLLFQMESGEIKLLLAAQLLHKTAASENIDENRNRLFRCLLAAEYPYKTPSHTQSPSNFLATI